MKDRILILGANGMAGHVIYLTLKSITRFKVFNAVHSQKISSDSIFLDVTNLDEVENLINEIQPKFVINCIGILIGGAKKSESNAIFINAFFPHFLKQKVNQIGGKLIHISTDCVFSGKKGGYKEEDYRDADDVYGRSKALGEVIDDVNMTIRTSIIGPELKSNGEGLFHWLMKQTGTVEGYQTAFWSGVTTIELASFIKKVMDKDYTGLYHLTNGKPINKYELLRIIKEVFSLDFLDIKPVQKNGIDKSLIQSERLTYKVPSYPEMIGDMYKFMIKYKSLYSQYRLNE